MAPRTEDAQDIIDKLHPRRPHIILNTGTIPLPPLPLVLSTSKNTNTVTFSFTMAATGVMLPQNVPSLPRSSTATFGTRDYADPLIVQRQFDRLQGSVDGLKTQVDGLKTQVDGLKTQVDERFKSLETEVDVLKTEVAGLKTEVTDLKTEVAGLKTQVQTGFAKLEAMILGLGVQVPQPAGAAPPSVQSASSSLSDEHGPEDGPPPSSVLPDPEHVSPSSSVPHSLDEGSPSVQGNSPSPSIEASYSSSPVLFARTYAESSEEAGPSIVNDIPALAQHVEETIDTAKQEIKTLRKKIASMLSLKNLKK